LLSFVLLHAVDLSFCVAFAQIRLGKCVFRGAWDSRHVNMHIQEFAENSADVQHFGPLHGQLTVPWTSIRVPGFTIKHVASWTKPKEDGELHRVLMRVVVNVGVAIAERKHVLEFSDNASLCLCGKELPYSSAKVSSVHRISTLQSRLLVQASVKFIGPASIVYFVFEKVAGVGDIILLQTHLPVGPMQQQTQFRYFADPALPRLLVWYVVGNWISQWKYDIRVWENKVYNRKPLLVRYALVG
jgi:cholesterol 7-desaturase